ncbi:EpsG family protein [Pseudomonas sp. MAP12]|uniref:EpsG family protein n=1 Tax=Geopseudomonas aromaticivorans TaxID=2849492 RepID=A0ABS6MVW2_9GAMM|nr:EpsG family protein [Pseudomonas aromaticivorans]MBV2132948.1 EpsG family protein [Pseudomonas aromaticivorans]
MSKISARTLYILLLALITGAILGTKDTWNWLDSEVYYGYLTKSIILSYEEILTQPDFGFYLILKSLNIVGLSAPQIWMLIATITGILTFTSTQQRTNNFLIFLMLYFSLYAWLHIYIQIRAALALSIFLTAIFAVKHPLPRTILFAISISIHMSIAIPLIAFLSANKIQINKKNLPYILILICLPVALISTYSLPFLPINRILVYRELLAEGEHSYINLFSALPAIQLATLSYIAINKNTTTACATAEYKMALIGTLCFYSFISIPVIAQRAWEMLSVIFILLLSRHYYKSKVLTTLTIMYFMFSLKSCYPLLLSPSQ